MNRNKLRNYTTFPVNKKKMYKKGKNWVVGSLTLIAMLGLGITVHADTTNEPVKANQPTPHPTITSQASNMHSQLLLNASNQNNNQTTQSNSTNTNTNSNNSKANIAQSNSNQNSQAATSKESQSSSNSSQSSSSISSKPKTTLNSPKPNLTNTQDNNSSTQADQNQKLSDINSSYRQFPFQPQGQDQVDQMNFVYLLNDKPMSANEVPDIAHTRTKSSDYSLSKYDENNPYKLYDGTKLYGYDILAHGGTPFSNDFSRYMPTYLNGYKLKKPVFPLNTPQVNMWNSKKIGTEFKGAGTNGITYYLDYMPAKNTIWYHIDNRSSVTALSDVSNSNNGNMNSDYDHNMSDFVKNAKNGKWANLPYSDVKVGYDKNHKPIYKSMQDVVVKTDINHRGYSDFFKKVGNNYKYGQSDLESYVPRQFTIDAEPMASITIHFLYNGKDVTTPIVRTGVEHQPFDISQYSNDLPQGYHYVNNTIENSTLSDANPKYFDEPCDTTAFGTVMQGAGDKAGQYSNNKDVNVILTKDNTDTINYSYNGKVLPNGWSNVGSIGNRDNSLATFGSKLGRMASDSDHAMSNDYNYLASNYKYPKGNGFTISLNALGKFSRLLGTTGHSDYGDTHAIIPLQKAQDTIKYIDMDNGKQIGSTWVNKLSSDMSSDNDSQLHQFRSDILNIASDLNSDATYSDLHNNYNLLSDYTIVKNGMFNKAQNTLTSNSTVSLGVRSFPYGKFNLVIPVQSENPASNYVQYVDANNPSNIISSDTLNGTLGQSDSDVNTDYINKHLPSDYQITQMPTLNNIKYDNSAITVPVVQKTTHINIKYVDLDNIYNPYGRNDPHAKYVNYYKELGSDKLTNNLQKPNIPFNVLSYNNTNFESAKAINDIAHVNNYQYSQMVSDNNVHQFSDKPQTIVIGLQKVGNNGITYDIDGDSKRPIASWTSQKKGTMNKDNTDIVNLHNTITPYNAPNLPSGYVIPTSSDGNGNSDYTKFTSDDNPLEPNNVNYYHYGHHYNIPVVKAQHTITVNFVNDDNNQFIQKAGSDTEKAGTPFDVTKYTHKLPSSDYYYVGIRNNRKDFGTKDYTVDALLKKYQGTINVNYIDETNHKKVIKAFPSTTRDVGTPFSSGSYLQNFPNGYRFDKMTGDVSKYIKGNHTIDIYLRQTSNITVNYVDALTNHMIQKAGSDTNIVDAPFNIASYESSNVLPKGYVFNKINNNTNHFTKNNQTVDILLRKLSTVGIHYVNAQTGSDVKDALSSTKPSGTNINLQQYQKNIPSGYKYFATQIPTLNSKFNGTTFDNNNHIITILLQRERGTIQINYIDKQNNKTIKTLQPITAFTNTLFNVDKYTHNLPSGYSYARISNNVTKFNDGNQTINIYLNKLGKINVNYVDNSSKPSQTLATKTDIQPINTSFDISSYLDNLPNGYNYVGMSTEDSKNSNSFDGTKFEDGTNTITIFINKEPTPKVARSTITINYVDVNNHKVHFISQAGKKTANVSTPFDISEYLNKIPNGYEYSGIKNANSNDNFNGTEFDYNNHTIDVLLRRVHPASVPSSTIKVNYVDNATHKLIKNVGNETEKINTPFNINKYFKYMPKDYQYHGVQNDVNNFDYNNHTVDILVSKIAPKESTIVVSYINRANGNLISDTLPQTQKIGTPFDINKYLDNIPNGYVYDGIHNYIDTFGNSDSIVDILLDKDTNKEVPLPSSASSKSSASAKPSSASVPSSSSSKPSSDSSSASVKPSSKTSGLSSKAGSASVKPSSKSSVVPSSTSTKPSSKATPSSTSSVITPSSSSASVPSSSSVIPVKPSSSSTNSMKSNASKASSSNAMPYVMPSSLASSSSSSKSKATSNVVKPTNKKHKAKPKTTKLNHHIIKKHSTNQNVNHSLRHYKKHPTTMNQKIRVMKHTIHTLRKEYNLPKTTRYSTRTKVATKTKKSNRKLPQTNESNYLNTEIIISILLLITGLSLSDLDLILKHKTNK